MKRAALVLVLAACGGARHHERYPVPPQVGALVTDDAAFARFAAAVRADATHDLASPALAAPAVHDRRFALAMLDALDARWPDAIAELDRIAAATADPDAKLMTGLTIRVWADAIAHEGDSVEGFRAALERGLARLPVARLSTELAMLRAMGQTFTPAVCAGLVTDSVGGHVAGGTVGFDDVDTIVFQRYAAVRLAPVGAVIDGVLAAHQIPLPP